jgi:hypothetical protein
LKCEKCGFISYDHNLACPNCNKDLSVPRTRLGVFYEPPEVDLEEFFTGSSGFQRATGAPPPPSAAAGGGAEEEAELDLDTSEEDFEFTLDD